MKSNTCGTCKNVFGYITSNKTLTIQFPVHSVSMLTFETFVVFDYVIVFAERPIENERILNVYKKTGNLLCSEHFHVIFLRDYRFDHLLDHFLKQLTLIFAHRILLPLIFPNVQMHSHDEITIFDQLVYTPVLERKGNLFTKANI